MREPITDRSASSARALAALLGPAFVAAMAYVDPGNFAANFSAGAEFGYALLWVLVVVNLMAACVQFLAAKVGFVTGRSLSELVGEHAGPTGRFLYWLQATLVVMATDIAEVIGGAVGLHLLFGVPLVVGGVITGIGSLALLLIHSRYGQRTFERLILLALLCIPLGFVAGLIAKPPEPGEVAAGLMPSIGSVSELNLAVAMLGATVMPHVIYLHTSLARDRFRGLGDAAVPRLTRATKVDVGLAMALAGSINISMLLLAATALRGMTEPDHSTASTPDSVPRSAPGSPCSSRSDWSSRASPPPPSVVRPAPRSWTGSSDGTSR